MSSIFSLRSSVSKGYSPVGEANSPYSDIGEDNRLVQAPTHSDETSSEDGMEDVEKRGLRKTVALEERTFSLNKILAVINITVLAVSIGVGAWSYVSLMRLKGNVNNALLRETSFYSPMHERISLSYRTQQVNGTLLNTHNSIYRQPPSPEVDAAWERLGNIDATSISSADVLALGKDVSKVAKYPDDFGLGPDAYVAELDVLHQIHCLNALRRDVYFSHYFGSKYPDGKPSELHRIHSDHCIYVLLQNLMCNANVDVITLDWVEGQKHPFPDFSINRKCMNFDAILDWQEKHAVDRTKFLAIKMPEDQTPARMSDDFKRMFGVVGDKLWHNHDSH